MIEARSISKRYVVHSHAGDRLHDWLIPFGPRRGRPFWALRDVDLRVERGSALGIVGANGAGKSTLLKIVTGTTVPTSGDVRVEGRVAALLELGMGFHPEFTGRENIGFNGRMLGMTDAEIAEKTPEIVEFSEIGEFLDRPLRTYSSGMALRLAFGVAAAMEPEVLIVDEALAVGDVHFQQKCLARIRRFHERGATVLFVSHDPGMIRRFCTEAILLDRGRVVDRDRPDQVLDHYNALLAERHREDGGRARIVRPREVEPAAPRHVETSSAAPAPAPDAEAPRPIEKPATERRATDASDPSEFFLPPTGGYRTGNFGGVITSVAIVAAGVGGESRVLTPGSRASVVVRAVALERIERPTVGILVKDRLGNEIFGTNTDIRDAAPGPLEPGQTLETTFSLSLELGPGVYTITVALHTGEAHTEVCYDWIERAELFQILPDAHERFVGACRLPATISSRVEAATPGEIEAAKGVGGGPS